jgi:alpha-D-ribose 1-methylphosphonate 5-triphosphate synthase subunit PhnI
MVLMGKSKNKDQLVEITDETHAVLRTVDRRIAAIVKNLAGIEKLGAVVSYAEDLILLQGKTTERALADALEKYKLV